MSTNFINSVSAFGTLGATIVATIHIAYIFSKDRNEKCMSQARLLSAWITEDDTIIISNKSDLLFYDTVVSFIINDAFTCDDYRNIIHYLPPGDWSIPGPEGWRGMCAYPGVELGFTDINGIFWIRTSRGLLKKIKTPQYYLKHNKNYLYDSKDYYNIELPCNYIIAKKIT